MGCSVRAGLLAKAGPRKWCRLSATVLWVPPGTGVPCDQAAYCPVAFTSTAHQIEPRGLRRAGRTLATQPLLLLPPL